MDGEARRLFLIRTLLAEQPEYAGIGIPSGEREQRELLRSLMNLRPPAPIGADFLAVQDEYLRELITERGVTDAEALPTIEEGICLWQGDITALKCGAIVNAANSQMLGCFRPLHNCIDNCIHTYAGVQLRILCGEIMKKQGHDEPTGGAKLTSAFNLPSEYIIHTVGPIVNGRLTDRHREQLASCYRSCLALAEENGIRSIAFCCISTGVFGFPQREAARIAVDTVREFLANNTEMRVIFNVFKDEDRRLYSELLGGDRAAAGCA